MIDNMNRPMVHKILREPHERLRSVSVPISEFDPDKMAILVQRLSNTMIHNRCYGLSLNQIGLCLRMFVFLPEGQQTPRAIVNPIVVDVSEESADLAEGCPSMPGVNVAVQRSKTIELVFRDVRGAEQRERFEGRDARVIQHEMDHLDGRMIIDRCASRQVLRRAQRDYENWLAKESKYLLRQQVESARKPSQKNIDKKAKRLLRLKSPYDLTPRILRWDCPPFV